MTTEKFIRSATKVHGKLYDYSQVIYIKSTTPVVIICMTHGQFSQTPYLHIRRKAGCPTCARDKRVVSRKARMKWLSYDEAKAVVRLQHFTTISEWNTWCKTDKPINIPSSPRTTYRSQWKGWSDWLGNERFWLEFEEARDIVRTLGLRSYEDWVFFCNTLQQKPPSIPFEPKKIYKNEWKGWGDWLGYSSRANGDLPGIIYVIRQSNLPSNVLKVGRTYRLDKRIYEHTRIQGTTLDVICTFEVSNMREAELEAHAVAREYGVPYPHYHHKEYFCVSDVSAFVHALSRTLNKK